MKENIGEKPTTKDEVIEAVNLIIDASSATSPELSELARTLLTHSDISDIDKTQLYNRMVKAWTHAQGGFSSWDPDLRGINIPPLPGLDLAQAILN